MSTRSGSCVCLTFFLLAAALSAWSQQENPMTFKDLLDKGIVTFVDKEFSLKARVAWDYADVKIPEDPTPMEKIRQKAGELKVPFDGAGFKNVRGKRYLWAKGADLVKKADADGKEVYAFKDVVLANGTQDYVMKVRLKLRSMFKPSHLENPAFVKQSNNPLYWTQTFELDILSVAVPP